jgi:hypothetical protein
MKTHPPLPRRNPCSQHPTLHFTRIPHTLNQRHLPHCLPCLPLICSTQQLPRLFCLNTQLRMLPLSTRLLPMCNTSRLPVPRLSFHLWLRFIRRFRMRRHSNPLALPLLHLRTPLLPRHILPRLRLALPFLVIMPSLAESQAPHSRLSLPMCIISHLPGLGLCW